MAADVDVNVDVDVMAEKKRNEMEREVWNGTGRDGLKINMMALDR